MGPGVENVTIFCEDFGKSWTNMEKYGKMPYFFWKNIVRFREDYRKTFKGRFREIDWAGKQVEGLG